MVYIKTFEDYKYNHYNNALGCQIYSKEHYEHEMKRQGMIPYDQAAELAEEYDRKNQPKDFKISEKALDIVRSLKLSSPDNDHIKIEKGGKAWRALKDMGVNFDDIDIHKKVREKLKISSGGFSDAQG
jgi:hypothetical protein